MTQEVSTREMRENVFKLEQALLAREHLDVDALTTHHFSDGVYMRELLIPAGHVCVGKIHRAEHLNILLRGTIAVLTEHGVRELTGPCIIKSNAGIKRAGYAVTDTVWMTVHPNPDNEQDLMKLEARYIAPDFEGIENVEPDQLIRQAG